MPTEGAIISEHDYNQLSPVEQKGWVYYDELIPSGSSGSVSTGDYQSWPSGYVGYYKYVPPPTDPMYTYVWDPLSGNPDEAGYWTTGRGSWGRYHEPYAPETPIVPAPKVEPSLMGDYLRSIGYNWLGPGTDIEYNLAFNRQPVDHLDEVAMEHDLAYLDVLQRYENGTLSYDNAVRSIMRADSDFLHSLRGFNDPMSLLAKVGMTGKMLYDWYTENASYSGLGSRYENLAKSDYSRYAEPEWISYPSTQTSIQYRRDIDPNRFFGLPKDGYGWEYTDLGWKQHKLRPFVPDEPKVEQPSVPIPVSEDRNRNGIPDVLEKKKKRKRRHFQISRKNQ